MYKRDIGKKIPKIKYNKLKKLLLQKQDYVLDIRTCFKT